MIIEIEMVTHLFQIIMKSELYVPKFTYRLDEFDKSWQRISVPENTSFCVLFLQAKRPKNNYH